MGSAAKKGRRGIAGIVAIVIIFAILFTVGTSYFIFVNAQNATYVSNLPQGDRTRCKGASPRASRSQLCLRATATWGSSLTTPLDHDEHDSGSGAFPPRAPFSSATESGSRLGAGCGNTTPALWVTMNAGAGSPSSTPGTFTRAGTTDTLKVLTARGNTYLRRPTRSPPPKAGPPSRLR